jgi:hypothetical protein
VTIARHHVEARRASDLEDPTAEPARIEEGGLSMLESVGANVLQHLPPIAGIGSKQVPDSGAEEALEARRE